MIMDIEWKKKGGETKSNLQWWFWEGNPIIAFFVPSSQQYIQYIQFLIYYKQLMEQSWFIKVGNQQPSLTLRLEDVQDVEGDLNQKLTLPLVKTVYGDDIVLTCANSTKDGCGFMLWFRKEDSKSQPTLYRMLTNLCQHDGNCQLTLTQTGHSPEGSQKELNQSPPTHIEELEEKLYSENEIALLKKQLQFQSKGLLSKSTDTDHDRNLITTIRFKCKNHPYANVCPFLHILEYKCHKENKPHYVHKPIHSEHIAQCILDEENIQYNVTARKIDASMNVLEEIVLEDATIKPKTILQRFGQRLGEENDEFLYEGLKEKNIKRSIKKYFDNAVAKAKNKVRQR